jgi:hypothetical protein
VTATKNQPLRVLTQSNTSGWLEKSPLAALSEKSIQHALKNAYESTMNVGLGFFKFLSWEIPYR